MSWPCVFAEDEWPDGLMCMDCGYVFRDGDEFSERLCAFQEDVPVVEVICVRCALGLRETA